MKKWLDQYQLGNEVVYNYTSPVLSDNAFVERPIINKTKEQFKKEAEQYAFNQRVLRDAYPNKFFTSTSNPIETIEKNLPYTLPNGQRKTFDKMNWREKNYVRGNALKQRGKINELPDALNPVQWVGDIAGNLAQAPYEARESNSNFPYVEAIANPVLAGMFGFDPLGSTIKFAKNPITQNVVKTFLDIPRAENVKEAIGRINGIPLKKDIPRMNPEDVKTFRKVQEIGRLRATNASYAEQMRYGLNNNLPEEHFQKLFGASKEEAQSLLDRGFGRRETAESNNIINRINLQRPPRRTSTPIQTTIDIMNSSPEEISNFAALAGMTEEELINFARSTMPTQNRSDIIRHTLDNYSSEINTGSRRGRTLIPGQEESRRTLFQTLSDDWNRYVDRKQPTSQIISSKLENFINKNIQDYPYHPGEVLEKVPDLFLAESGNLKNVSKKVNFAPQGIKSGDVFTGSTNTSHSSYLPQLKQVFKYTKGDPQFLGYKPMNPMGFLSKYGYGADDISKYLNSEIDEQIKRGVIPKDILRPFQKGEHVMLPHYGVKQHKHGGIIKDNRGQWAHPGKPTRISSPNITMEGVPYPILAKANNGMTTMMYPEQDYYFPGANYVDEYPMMQGGGNVAPFITSDINEYKKRKQAYDDSLSLYRVGEAELKRFYDGDPGQSYGKIKNLQDLNKATRDYSGEIPKNQLYDTNRDLLLNSKGNVSKISSIYNRTGILPTEFWASQGFLNYRFKKPVQQVLYKENLNQIPTYNNYSINPKLTNKKIIPQQNYFIPQPSGAPVYTQFPNGRLIGYNTSLLPSQIGSYTPEEINKLKQQGIFQEYEDGGEMIKRADGSYSRRGLWDNIRANRGSGKKPTKQMLEQERKIRNKYQEGGEQDIYWRTGKPMVNDPSMDAISKVLLQRNLDKNFMQRAAGFGYQGGIPTKYIPGQDPNSNDISTLLMGSSDNIVYPTIIQTGPEQLSYQPYQTQEYIEAPSWDVADYFATKGYKRAANDMYGMEYQNGGEKERSFLETITNFLPYYETYLDVKDVIQGSVTGNKTQMNQGIIGMGQPFAGKAIINSLDYLTEKMLGKQVANEMLSKRESIVNMTDRERIELFKRYGYGGYDKWVKNGKPKLANGGYVVRRSHDRKGKTHVVIGPDGTKKYFGDPNMGERGKSKHGKEAFYARHKHNLAKNPYFRAYARATWEEGGQIMKAQDGKIASSNTNDFLIQPEEYHLYTDRLKNCAEGRGCLEQAFNYYDNYIAPTLKTPSSWDIKEKAGISSGKKNPRYADYEESADSWDIHGLLQEKGAKKILAADVNSPYVLNNNINKMPKDKQVEYFRKLNLPVGAIIGMGVSGGTGGHYGTKSYNKKKGLASSNHSAVVIGYDNTGLPILYDYGDIVPITNRKFSFPITNITAPKETSQYTYDYLKNKNMLENNYSPLEIKTNSAEYDEDEYVPFVNALTEKKKKIANALGLQNNEYDELARKAAALALTETGGGDDTSVRWKFGLPIPSYLTDKMGIGDTRGITQINTKMLFSNPQIASKLKNLGITEFKYDPWNPEHIAAATMALLQSNIRPQQSNYKKNVTKLGYDPNLSDAAISYYQWNQPKLLRKGEALGNSQKVKNFVKNYNLVSTNTTKKLGGQSTLNPITSKDNRNWLDFLKN